MHCFRTRSQAEPNQSGQKGHALPVWERADWLFLLSLAALVVLVFWRLALTNLIVGRGDLFFYFYPYREFASQAIRNARIPFWNPYSFMGVPFLANSQAGVFYPPNILLAWLPVARSVNVSIVAHAALAAIGTYLWARARLGLTRAGAWLAALVFALGGYFVAQIEHLNQMQALAWLPWLLWVYRHPHRDGFPRFSSLKATAYQISGLGLILALQMYGGHIQSFFISAVGLLGYAVLPVMWEVVRGRVSMRTVLQPVVTVFGAAILGSLLAAVQLIPTFELSQLSIRSGGLPYNEAVSFSLAPELLARALLPGWASPLFPEYVAYIGVAGLALAVLGASSLGRMAQGTVLRTSRDDLADAYRSGRELAQLGAVFLALLGLFLALGGYNPIYSLLVRFVPGFASFRVPARWLALYAIGMSGLVGIGFDALCGVFDQRSWQNTRRSHRRWWLAGLGAITIAVAWALLGEWIGGDRHRDLVPALQFSSIAGWFAAAFAFGGTIGLILLMRRTLPCRLARIALAILVILELFAASVFLPLNRATAPGALTSLRPAVAHLLGSATAGAQAPADRFLSISDILFDPGDKEDLEIILEPQLPDEAVYDYLIATKQKEVLIPNLPLYYGLPAVDGYDGGVLPLRRFVTLMQLILPPGKVAIDGRLREHLDSIPPGLWLSLFNVQHIITDKVGDAWHDDVFYDLQMGAKIEAGSEVVAGHIPPTDATALGVVFQVNSVRSASPLAIFDVAFSDGEMVSLPLLAQESLGSPTAARLRWDRPATVERIAVRGVTGQGVANILGLSLIDERTGSFVPVPLSDSGRYRLVHSGDVKIYENLDVLPRAMFVDSAVWVTSDEDSLSLLRDSSFDPMSCVILSASDSSTVGSSEHEVHQRIDGSRVDVEILRYAPEHVILRVDAPNEGWLVLSDAWYPGWQASLDGTRVPVERANILFRAVRVPAGEHEVEMIFRPSSFRIGASLSLAAISLLVAFWSFTWLRKKRGRAGNPAQT